MNMTPSLHSQISKKESDRTDIAAIQTIANLHHYI